MSYFPRRKSISAMVGRKGRDRRGEIVGRYALNPAKHLGLIYFGHYGVNDVDFGLLQRFPDWEFIGVCELKGNAPNYRRIDKKDFLYQDLVASVDVMVCKPGYGAVSECMLHGTPLVYLPRGDFAEFPALDAAARAWGGGHLLSTEKFLSLEWQPALDAIVAKGPPAAVTTGGAEGCAAAIELVARGG
jgi:L-arabinokinase